MKKLIGLLLAVTVMTSVLAGCGSREGELGNIKDTLVIGTNEDVHSLDVQAQQNETSNMLFKNTHQTLVYYSNEQTCEPGLALIWEFTDFTHVLFYLRDDVTFSDGTPLTAEDVKFTLDMAKEKEAASLLRNLVSVTVVDDLIVELEITAYTNEFIQSLADVSLSIQSKAAYESGMDEPYRIGTGPYKLEEWEKGEFCRIVKVENYWGEKTQKEVPEYYAPGVSGAIEFRPYIEDSSRLNALRNGDIDVCLNPPRDTVKNDQEDENIILEEQQGTDLVYFAFHTGAEPWDNQTLRQAAACAIDREAILEAAVCGSGILQKTVLNYGLWGFYDEMDGFDYDVDRAKELMKNAGYPGGDSDHILIESSISYAAGSPYDQIAAIIQENLREIGIEVSLCPMEYKDLAKTCEQGEQELFLWHCNEDKKTDNVYRDLFYTDSPNNYCHYSDARVDELTDVVAVEIEEEARLEASRELQTYLVEACPQVPLYSANLLIAYHQNLRGQNLFGNGSHYWAHAYLEE